MIPAHILLVEDDLLILRTLAQGLRQAGYDVSEAGSAEEALQIAEQGRPDLAVLDIRMPGHSGLDLARWLAEKDIAFLFLSAYNDPDFVDQAKFAGALAYLVKPVDVPQLVPMLETALARTKEWKKLRKNEERLVAALHDSRQISTAVGVLMERDGVTPEQAFQSLRELARHQRAKIANVARCLLGKD